MYLKIKEVLSFKYSSFLADIFNNDIYSSRISKRVNYFLIAFITLATIEIICSTEPGLSKYESIFNVIYFGTSTVFLIEIMLRLMVSKHISEKYIGFRGKFRFASEFYNLVDIISIMPFLFGFIGIELYPFLKALRVFRILKIMRYLPALQLLQASVNNKKSELIISLQTIFMLAVLLSIGLYYAESDVKESQFSSISQALLWSLASFIGDIGGYGGFIPLSTAGKILATLNGILGIAIFALPAGVIGSGFIEEIENEKIKKNHIKGESEIKHAFGVEYFAPVIKVKKALNLSHLPRKWLSLEDIKYKMNMSEESVMDIVGYSKLFRLRSVKSNGISLSGLEFINLNRSYGQYVNRSSTITIVNLYASMQPYFGHFSLAVADILKANYISNELYSNLAFLKKQQLNMIVNDDYLSKVDSHPSIKEIKDDVKDLLSENDTCIFLVNAGSNENLMQFNIGGEVGDDSFVNGHFFRDKEKIKKFYDRAVLTALNNNKRTLRHGTVGIPVTEHIAHFIHKETGCNLVMLHVNVEILKKNPVEYYNHINEFANIFS